MTFGEAPSPTPDHSAPAYSAGVAISVPGMLSLRMRRSSFHVFRAAIRISATVSACSVSQVPRTVPRM